MVVLQPAMRMRMLMTVIVVVIMMMPMIVAMIMIVGFVSALLHIEQQIVTEPGSIPVLQAHHDQPIR